MRSFTIERIYVARITAVEITSAFTRRRRDATLSLTEATKAMARFRRAFDQRYFRVDITNKLLDRAAALAVKHALRGYDAAQLAADNPNLHP